MRITLTTFLLFPLLLAAQHHITSPNGAIRVSVTAGQSITISAEYKGTAILNPSEIGLAIRGVEANWKIRKSSVRDIDNQILPPVPEKRKVIRDHYNELTIAFRSKLTLNVRAYDDGFAYRFGSSLNDSIIIEKEIAEYSLPGETRFYGSPVAKRQDVDIYHTSFEEPYVIKSTDSISEDLLFFTPVMIAYPNGMKADR